MKKFTIYTFLTSTIFILSIVGFNYWIDAFGVFNPQKDIKYDATGFLSTIKTYWIKKGDYDGVIIGTSRAHNAFDPDLFASISDIKYFNIGQSAQSYSGAKDMVSYTKEEGFENYLILLDTYILPYLDSELDLTRMNFRLDKSDSKKNKDFYGKENLHNLFSINSISKSMDKVMGKEKQAVWKSNGHNTLGADRFQCGKRIKGPMWGRLLSGSKRNFADHKFDAFKESFKTLCSCDGKVQYIFPPINMYFLSAIEYENYGVTHDFKTKVSSYVLENKSKCKANIVLVDYMYPNRVTREDLSVEGIESENYRDFTHFRTDVGTMMITELETGNFNIGVPLNEKNYKGHLKRAERSFARFHNDTAVPLMKNFNLIDSLGKVIPKRAPRPRK